MQAMVRLAWPTCMLGTVRSLSSTFFISFSQAFECSLMLTHKQQGGGLGGVLDSNPDGQVAELGLDPDMVTPITTTSHASGERAAFSAMGALFHGIWWFLGWSLAPESAFAERSKHTAPRQLHP
eukprot:CAMPEP_0202912462 /NCGR_PEP_ID=MMETSP1392-20130828/57812_1 /ASSEMBLY_ACC=CAM_ASM_000868 /TAXON_ID=225041 /ORGANISM="Chlamydomonas chlamydogama, Strain SAG 11-48b" /LENGTH=123 /DNA_ID=CAMNT_0049603373 /DNA_START=2141 /DNA_END=2512 /DNA_ORIENTATION=-